MKDTTDAANDVATESSFAVEPEQSPIVRIEDDFYGWLLGQASILRKQRYGTLDWSNLAEELEAMGRSEENSLESYLVRLLKHLLKYRYQHGKITGSWEASIEIRAIE